MLRYIWLVIVLVVIAIVVILLVPDRWLRKLGAIVAVIAVAIIVYTSARAYTMAYEQEQRDIISQVDTHYISIMRIFSDNPELLEDMQSTVITPRASVVLRMMIRSIESAGSITTLSGVYLRHFREWVSLPAFREYWKSHSNEYPRETQQLIENLMAQ